MTWWDGLSKTVVNFGLFNFYFYDYAHDPNSLIKSYCKTSMARIKIENIPQLRPIILGLFKIWQ